MIDWNILVQLIPYKDGMEIKTESPKMHPHVISNLYIFYSSVEQKIRHFEESWLP